ncbi:hypothetical protein ACI65C_012783 [Semiaphis heraclei]
MKKPRPIEEVVDDKEMPWLTIRSRGGQRDAFSRAVKLVQTGRLAGDGGSGDCDCSGVGGGIDIDIDIDDHGHDDHDVSHWWPAGKRHWLRRRTCVCVCMYDETERPSTEWIGEQQRRRRQTDDDNDDGARYANDCRLVVDW